MNTDEGMLVVMSETVRSCLQNWQIKSLFSLIGGFYSSVSAGDSFLLACVFSMMCVDVVFGLSDSIMSGTYSPHRLSRGIGKFFSYSVTILLVMFISAGINTAVGANIHIQDFFMSYLMSCEALSIIRHMENLGLPVPALARKIAFGVQKKAEEKVEAMAQDANNKPVL